MALQSRRKNSFTKLFQKFANDPNEKQSEANITIDFNPTKNTLSSGKKNHYTIETNKSKKS